jgi:hypothetical protein
MLRLAARLRSLLGWAEWAGAPLLLAACIDPSQAAPASRDAPVESEPDVVVLLNNLTVDVTRDRLVALRSDGETAWELAVPNGDTIIAPAAVGLNSVTYVRSTTAIHAAVPDGAWLWSRPLEGRAYLKSRAADSPTTLSDSTVALVVGDDIVRFDHAGNVRWRTTLPEGHVSSRLAAGMDGSLIASTTAGLFAVGPEGNVVWRRTLR